MNDKQKESEVNYSLKIISIEVDSLINIEEKVKQAKQSYDRIYQNEEDHDVWCRIIFPLNFKKKSKNE